MCTLLPQPASQNGVAQLRRNGMKPLLLRVAHFARNPILLMPFKGLLAFGLKVAHFERKGGSLWSGICTASGA